MTAGYFSSIARVQCTYSPAQPGTLDRFIVKAWPPFELLPKDAIKGMFILDMKAYSEFPSAEFYPRPLVYLASYDLEQDRWALVLED